MRREESQHALELVEHLEVPRTHPTADTRGHTPPIPHTNAPSHGNPVGREQRRNRPREILEVSTGKPQPSTGDKLPPISLVPTNPGSPQHTGTFRVGHPNPPAQPAGPPLLVVEQQHIGLTGSRQISVKGSEKVVTAERVVSIEEQQVLTSRPRDPLIAREPNTVCPFEVQNGYATVLSSVSVSDRATPIRRVVVDNDNLQLHSDLAPYRPEALVNKRLNGPHRHDHTEPNPADPRRPGQMDESCHAPNLSHRVERWSPILGDHPRTVSRRGRG